MSIWFVLLISVCYIGALFSVAWYGDRRAQDKRPIHQSSVIYSLSLAVYCTSWTFYGVVGQAGTGGWSFLSVYAGPILFSIFGWRLLKKVVRISKEKRLTSIADFIATRYGRSHYLGMLVTWIAILGVIPYIALQLKAISTGFELLVGLPSQTASNTPFWKDTAFHISWVMALFSITFGTRNTDASEQHPGLILAIAFESIVKLVAFLVVGFWLSFCAFDSPLELHRLAKASAPEHPLFSSPVISVALIVQTLLASFAFIGLPRQFQVGVIESESTAQIRSARWMFPIYLILMGLFVYPIALSGAVLLNDSSMPADLLVLNLPIHFDQPWLTVLAFIGGASAATGMVIVATLAISTMISNEWILPAFFKQQALVGDVYRSANVRRLVFGVRRLSIAVLMLISYGFYRITGEFETLASFGLLSFAAVAQFAPSLIGGMLWRVGNRYGAISGLVAGALVWFYTLFWPTFSQAFFSLDGPNLTDWSLGLDDFSMGVFLSLSTNLALYVLVSMFSHVTVRERLLASEFTSNEFPAASKLTPHFDCKVEDVREVLIRVLGKDKTEQFFREYSFEFGYQFDTSSASHHLLRESEKLLASVVGASSARLIFTTLLGGEQVNIRDITLLASEASQAHSVNREQLKAALEHLSQGVSVVDKDLNIVAWNSRYLELYDYPSGLIYAGKPVREIIQFNCQRGYCGSGNVQSKVDRRMFYLQRGDAHEYERELPSGVVISMKGHPMPDGGYVTSFTDVTAYRQAEKALKQANIVLEKRVEKSSQQLADLTSQLIDANTRKTNLLAETSHDLIQPLNAAKLFASTLAQQSLTGDQQGLIKHLEGALQSAEDVLSVLVEISKLDAGVMEPKLRPVNVGQILQSLCDETRPIAEKKGLELRYRGQQEWGLSDAHWLRRIVQNLLSNAVRYTQSGGVLLSCRRRQGMLCIEVWDTGPGIPNDQIDDLFVEFKRLKHEGDDGQGLGLGLAIVDRMAKKLQHLLSISSKVSTGTRFQLFVPTAQADVATAQAPSEAPWSQGGFNGLTVFCIDNDDEGLMALKVLLESWQCQVFACRSKEEAALYNGKPDIILADYQLDNGDSGLDVMTDMDARLGGGIPGVLISAAAEENLPDMSKERGFYFLKKPIKPAALRALIRRLV